MIRYNGFPLYVYAAALKELLYDDDDSEIFKYARKGNNEIWAFLNASGFIPSNYRSKLIDYTKEWTIHLEDDTYEDVFDMTLPELEAQGAQKIDCDLYIAAASLNFEKTKHLLEKGANPHAKLGIDADFYNIINHCHSYWYDIYEPCEHIMETWARGMKGIDEKIAQSLCYRLITSVGHKIMYDLLISS